MFGDELCAALKRGYEELLRRSAEDPNDQTGLLFQTWLHDYYCGCDSKGGDVHTTWDFLPWHRAFIYFHERILADAAKYPGLRLPVWDWETDPSIPPFYTKLGLPSFLTGAYLRAPAASGDAKRLVSQCVLQAWLLSQKFADFCGTACEDQNLRAAAGPHSSVHTSLVGGAMGAPVTAAADPIFYAHHTNIDRFWDCWRRHYKDFDPPADWLTRTFYFYDEHRQLVRVQTWQLLDECQLGYRYTTRPKVDLHDLESHQLPPEDWLDPTKLGAEIGALVLGRLLAQDPSLLERDDLRTLICGAILPPLRRKEHSRAVTLPVRIRVAPVGDDHFELGKYYLVQVRRGNQERANIGGFGIFSPPMGGGEHIYEVTLTGCVDANALFLILCGTGTLGWWYGQPDSTGADIRAFRAYRLRILGPSEIISPRGAYQSGKAWLASHPNAQL